MGEKADKFGVDPVKRFFRDHLTAKKFEEKVEGWFVEQSMLGGKIEGVVIKRYLDVGQMRGKWVRPEFKEKLNKPLKDKQDFLDNLVERYATEARFEKIVQHGKEQGELIGEMKDLSYLCKDLVKDVFEEEGEEIEEVPLTISFPLTKTSTRLSGGFRYAMLRVYVASLSTLRITPRGHPCFAHPVCRAGECARGGDHWAFG